MREIKFRLWSKIEKKFVCSYMSSVYMNPTNGELYSANLNVTGYYEIMQYTGLKDKNDVEIYEGDILKVVVDDSEHEFTHKVEFNEVCGGYIIDVEDCSDYDMTTLPWASESCYYEYNVIGNIHENPELLESDK